jgi:hypothetical protein
VAGIDISEITSWLDKLPTKTAFNQVPHLKSMPEYSHQREKQ